jgi:Cof subfamily protein (haloacid dehalogenase superfamily)
MGKFDGILICTDLDGTLLNNAFKVSPENAEAIRYFKAEGGLFTFITGRLYYFVHDSYNMVKPNAPIGTSNGGSVYDFETGKYIWSTTVDPSYVELLDLVKQEMPQIGFHVNIRDEILFCHENNTMRDFRLVTGVPYKYADYHTLQEPVMKVVFGSNKPEWFAPLEELLRSHPKADRFQFVRSTSTIFEILPKGVHKGTVLPVIAKHLGIDEKGVIAIGDYDNDAGMLKTAHLGIAVANATEKAKAAADMITVSNQEHAIARLIQDLGDGTIKL